MGQIGIKKLDTDIQTRNDLYVTQNPYGEFELTSIYNNARDAYEASEIVLGLLNKHTKSKFLLSTHIIELAETFYNEKTCQFNYMESEIKEDRFICSYKLKEGISESRIGSWLVKKELAID